MLSFGYCDLIYADLPVPNNSFIHTLCRCLVYSLIVIIQLMLSVPSCPKVITLSSFHCISLTNLTGANELFGAFINFFVIVKNREKGNKNGTCKNEKAQKRHF
jgi:hypothetical protein